jgi:multiple sugar transport system substrate-binding protein
MRATVTAADLAGLDRSERSGITRRTFVRGALSAALAGPLLFHPALQRLAHAADWSGKTLRFMLINPHAGSIEPLSAAFADITGATVEATKVPYEQITAQATLDVGSGANSYDVFEYWYADKGALVRDGVLLDITDRIDAETDDIDADDFLGALYDTYTLVDGRRYGLPYDGDTHVLFYNRAILDKAGVKAPETWDEYTAVAQAVTDSMGKSGTYGCLLMAKQFPIIICSTFANRLGGFGGDFLDKDGRPALTTGAAVAAAQAMLDAAPHALPTPLETEFGNSIPVFLGGTAGMIEFWTDMGTWAADPAQSKIVDTWGVLPMPVGGSNKINRPAMNAGFGFAVSAGSAEPDMAWEFIRMAGSKEFHVTVLTDNKTGVDPIRKSAMEAYKQFAPKQAAAVEEAIVNAFPWPTVPESPQLMQALNDELGLMMAGQKTAEQALTDAQASWEQELGG